ncbi:hypothetical protein C8Q72DRAFT_799414 [Fomitopsis betulina]|nr:hypothetical protein C8Q72DRAFT_799414 [Fomitopsis betulina]
MVQGKVTEVALSVGPMGETQGKGRRNPRGHGSGDESESGGASHGKGEGYSGWRIGSVLGARVMKGNDLALGVMRTGGLRSRAEGSDRTLVMWEVVAGRAREPVRERVGPTDSSCLVDGQSFAFWTTLTVATITFNTAKARAAPVQVAPTAERCHPRPFTLPIRALRQAEHWQILAWLSLRNSRVAYVHAQLHTWDLSNKASISCLVCDDVQVLFSIVMRSEGPKDVTEGLKLARATRCKRSWHAVQAQCHMKAGNSSNSPSSSRHPPLEDTAIVRYPDKMHFFGKTTVTATLALAPFAAAQMTCGTLCTPRAADSCPLDLVCMPITVPVGIIPGCNGDISIDMSPIFSCCHWAAPHMPSPLQVCL